MRDALASLLWDEGCLWCDFPIHGFCRAHLQLLSPVLCKCNRVEHRNSNRYTKYRDSSFQTLPFKIIIKPNSPNVVEDLKGSRRSMFCRWQIKWIETVMLSSETCSVNAPRPILKGFPSVQWPLRLCLKHCSEIRWIALCADDDF